MKFHGRFWNSKGLLYFTFVNDNKIAFPVETLILSTILPTNASVFIS